MPQNTTKTERRKDIEMQYGNEWQGAHEVLCKGRLPFANANLTGEDGFPSVCGSVEFYSTPMGVLICAQVRGLPCDTVQGKKPKAYGICLGNSTSSERREQAFCTGHLYLGKHRAPCTAMPTLYEKNGSLWCSVMTGRITPADLAGKMIRVHESTGSCPMIDHSLRQIARGEIRCTGIA